MGISPAEILTQDWDAPHAGSASGERAYRLVIRTALVVASRLAFGALLLVTSTYCLLVYIPFSYFGFIHNPLLSWLPTFVRIHSYLFACALTLVAVTLAPDMWNRERRKSAAAFLLLNGVVAVAIILRPALDGMMRDFFAYVWSMLCLFPLIWLAALDLSAYSWRQKRTAAAEVLGSLRATTFAALAVSLVFASVAVIGGKASDGRSILASAAFHLALFTLAGIAGVFVAVIARKLPQPSAAYFAGLSLVAWLICAGVIRKIILPTLSFDGWQAGLYAAIAAAAVAMSVAGAIARVRSMRSTHRGSKKQPVWMVVPALILLALTAYEIPHRLAGTDWDFVLQKTAVVMVWVAAAVFFRWLDLRGRAASGTSAAALLIACLGTGFFLLSHDASARADWSSNLEVYAGSDISFKTANDILSRSLDNEAYDDFYRFLQQNTNLGPDVPASPADTRLVAHLNLPAGKKPNIFLFVIDSLRKDYIAPYNPAATYAPQIADFASDSVVMQNAFTHYAGTALSEPAIWVGAMQLHKQYVEPFYPMNNLQKLLDAGGYQSYISVDPILAQILQPDASIVELDKNVKLWNDLDFVPTLKELQAKLAARTNREKPIFAYTQPQNVHTVTLARTKQGGSRREMSINELRRMDTAFGDFIRFLKQEGMYDDSIIILTSDHGDSYGEFGRYGHSDFLFPEIIRVPLIVHLPAQIKSKLVWDTKQVAFSTDITPSLYYLLGCPPVASNELFGRALFVHGREELGASSRSEYLLASSYAPVYGVLGNSGQSLFIVDAVNHKNYFYDLAADPQGVHNRVTPKIRDENEPVIRRELGLIDSFYKVTPPN